MSVPDDSYFKKKLDLGKVGVTGGILIAIFAAHQLTIGSTFIIKIVVTAIACGFVGAIAVLINRIRHDKVEYKLPGELPCPDCGNDLSLEEHERISGNYECPSCQYKYGQAITQESSLKATRDRMTLAVSSVDPESDSALTSISNDDSMINESGTTTATEVGTGPVGLGGWLVLVGLGLILAPLRIIAQVIPLYLGMVSDGSLEILTTPGTEAYNPLWSPIIYGELAVNFGMVIALVFIAYLFFSKKRAFPKWFIGICIVNVTVIVVDAFATKLVLPEEPMFDADTTVELGRMAFAALVWIPYMLVSKRVKATFVN